MTAKKRTLPFVPLEAMVRRAPIYARLDLRLKDIAPTGYVLALQMNEFFRPELAYSALPRAWFEHYTAMDFLPADPVLQWAAAHSGSARWSEIAQKATAPGAAKVMAHAANHDLKFGAIVSAKNQMIGLRRSFLSCARSDREFTDAEIERIDEIFHEILALSALYAPLTTACHEVMTMLALGMSQIEIANRLGISRDTVRKRIERTCEKLGARNAAHALAMAVESSIVSAYS